MSKSSQAVKDWRNRTKSRIIEAMGGKCQSCGYDKLDAALELHHLDPDEKDFSIGGIRANPQSWETIVKELRKCIMLCCLCHREVEYGTRKVKSKSSFSENYAGSVEIFHRHSKYSSLGERTCKLCNGTYSPASPNQKFCTELCRNKHKRQNRS